MICHPRATRRSTATIAAEATSPIAQSLIWDDKVYVPVIEVLFIDEDVIAALARRKSSTASSATCKARIGESGSLPSSPSARDAKTPAYTKDTTRMPANAPQQPGRRNPKIK